MNNVLKYAQLALVLVIGMLFVVTSEVVSATEIPAEIKAVNLRLDAARLAAEKELYQAKIKANEEAIKELEKLVKAERKKSIPRLTVELNQRIQALTLEVAELHDDKMMRAKVITQRLRNKEYSVDEWEAVISPIFTVSGTAPSTATKLPISAGQVYLVVPHPGDGWQASGDVPACDWRGYPDGTMRLQWFLGEKNGDQLFISEPGLLVLGGFDADHKDNQGSIRVKLIRVR